MPATQSSVQGSALLRVWGFWRYINPRTSRTFTCSGHMRPRTSSYPTFKPPTAGSERHPQRLTVSMPWYPNLSQLRLFLFSVPWRWSLQLLRLWESLLAVPNQCICCLDPCKRAVSAARAERGLWRQLASFSSVVLSLVPGPQKPKFNITPSLQTSFKISLFCFAALWFLWRVRYLKFALLFCSLPSGGSTDLDLTPGSPTEFPASSTASPPSAWRLLCGNSVSLLQSAGTPTIQVRKSCWSDQETREETHLVHSKLSDGGNLGEHRWPGRQNRRPQDEYRLCRTCISYSAAREQWSCLPMAASGQSWNTQICRSSGSQLRIHRTNSS